MTELNNSLRMSVTSQDGTSAALSYQTCKQNPTNNNWTLKPVVIPNSAVYVICEQVEFPFYTPGENVHKLNLNRRLTPLSNNVRKSLNLNLIVSLISAFVSKWAVTKLDTPKSDYRERTGTWG